MRKFEYDNIMITGPINGSTIECLNRLGQQGWELVSAERHPSGGYAGLFKREIVETIKLEALELKTAPAYTTLDEAAVKRIFLDVLTKLAEE